MENNFKILHFNFIFSKNLNLYKYKYRYKVTFIFWKIVRFPLLKKNYEKYFLKFEKSFVPLKNHL